MSSVKWRPFCLSLNVLRGEKNDTYFTRFGSWPYKPFVKGLPTTGTPTFRPILCPGYHAASQLQLVEMFQVAEFRLKLVAGWDTRQRVILESFLRDLTVVSIVHLHDLKREMTEFLNKNMLDILHYLGWIGFV